jgi:hypothetical protein
MLAIAVALIPLGSIHISCVTRSLRVLPKAGLYMGMQQTYGIARIIAPLFFGCLSSLYRLFPTAFILGTVFLVSVWISTHDPRLFPQLRNQLYRWSQASTGREA